MTGSRMGASPFWLGAGRCVPLAASVVPFAIVVALAARGAGLSALETLGMSVVVFAGAAQLVALELARGDAPAAIIIGAAIVVNLRFVLYSASLAPHMREVSTRTRAAIAYVLTDQAFAIAAARPGEHSPGSRVAFFGGAGATLWVAWQLGTALGLTIGSSMPPELSLDFAVALVFVALVVPALRGRPELAAATVSVAVYLAAAGLPYGLGLVPAAVAGIATGGLVARGATP